MVEQFKKDVFISEDLRYFQLTNIFFDSPLNEEKIKTIKEIFFSINNISQIYFTDNFDLKGIEIVKSILEISPTMEDSMVEKYILNSSKLDENKLLKMNFSNPDTWLVSTSEDENSFTTITIDKYREETNIINRFISSIDNEYSLIEKVMYVYDFCKKLNYVNNQKDDLLDILKTNKSNQKGYSYLFNKLLNSIGIKSFLATSITDNLDSYVTLLYIKDNKYGIDGIYLFDPFSDSISSNQATEKLRGINYNYFLITIPTYLNTVFNDKLTGVASCLTHDYEYDIERLRRVSNKEFKNFIESFDMDFLDIYKKVNGTLKVDDQIKLDIVKKVNKSISGIHEVVCENYYARKEQISKYALKKSV